MKIQIKKKKYNFFFLLTLLIFPICVPLYGHKISLRIKSLALVSYAWLKVKIYGNVSSFYLMMEEIKKKPLCPMWTNDKVKECNQQIRRKKAKNRVNLNSKINLKMVLYTSVRHLSIGYISFSCFCRMAECTTQKTIDASRKPNKAC